MQHQLGKDGAVVARALSRIDVESPTWQTLVVGAHAESDMSPKQIWSTWSRIEDWAGMSPLVATARWTNGQPWRVGSQFVQELNLGFPIGRDTAEERVMSVEPGVAAEWGRKKRGLRAIHLWRFDPLGIGGVRITNVEVLHGPVIGFVKPFVAARWHRLFEAQIEGLISKARKNP